MQKERTTIVDWCKTPGQSFLVKVALHCRQPNCKHLKLYLKRDDVPWDHSGLIERGLIVDENSCFFGIGAGLVCFGAFLIEALKRYASGERYWDGQSFTGRICSLSNVDLITQKKLVVTQPRVIGDLWHIEGPFVVSLDSIPF